MAITGLQQHNATLQELKECKLGYRAKYVLDTSRIIASGEIDFDKLKKSDYQETKELLLKLPGIGDKVADCVMLFSLENLKIDKKTIEEKVNSAAKLLQIEDYLQRKPKALSGGQRQRVAIGRAIVRDPKAFLFDEPLSNLDAKLRVEMRREIKKLHQKLKTTVVYVTHDQTEAMSLGTKIAIMNHGVIQQNESPEIIYNKPSNTFVADFIGSPSMNLIKGKLKQSLDKILFTAEGANFDVPVNDYDFDNTSQLNDKEVYFGIRPEHIHYKKTNDTDFEVNLRADLSEYIGHEQIITFNLANQELLALTCFYHPSR